MLGRLDREHVLYNQPDQYTPAGDHLEHAPPRDFTFIVLKFLLRFISQSGDGVKPMREEKCKK